MKASILYQSDEDGERETMGVSLDQLQMKEFEEYLNRVQKYNFYVEDVLIDSLQEFLKNVKTVSAFEPQKIDESTMYLTNYLFSYYTEFSKKRASDQSASFLSL